MPWIAAAAVAVTLTAPGDASAQEPAVRAFVEAHCLDCHEGEDAKAGLDLSRLGFALTEARTFATWVKVHDRVRDGEMPPRQATSPLPRGEVGGFLRALAQPMVASDRARAAAQGRATRRRLNRHEYEATLRDLLHAPWLQVKAMLPEDGEAHRSNKVGDALDVSHVQMAQHLAAADHALRAVLAARTPQPSSPAPVRYYAREMRSFARRMAGLNQGTNTVRRTFPVLGFSGQPDVMARRAPATVGAADPARRELEGVGIVASSYEPIEPTFDRFRAPRSGRYRLRLNALTAWVGPRPGDMWFLPDMATVSRGRRPEPVTLYAERSRTLIRHLASFDVGPDPTARQVEVHLLEGETIRPDAARLFRSRPSRIENPPLGDFFRNPLAQKDGQPAVVYRWLEVEGPLPEEHDPFALLFGDLPVRVAPGGALEVTPSNLNADARRLLQVFMARAYRQPVSAEEVDRFARLVGQAIAAGDSFADAMIAGYAAVLCSPGFLYLDETPGALDSWALASRLSYFLWNSAPDEALRAAAARGDLVRPEILQAHAVRLLEDPKSRRFVDAFLDYWLDLRHLTANSPDAVLYPDYNLDDLLLESAAQETQLFFRELLRQDLPARNLIDSNFVFVNERLAVHYRLPTRALGVELRRASLPRLSPRGGLLAQASVLKVTANGTTTSPVLRGAWIAERLLGYQIPPPPPGVPAVEPDIRGARTIREQLAKHRADKACAGCHAKIDPAGFALESFDVFGGWRDRYRAMGGKGQPREGFGKDGLRIEHYEGPPVDPTGTLPDGRPFRDVNELKRLLVRDERQIARTLTRQLVVHATGAPVRFGDRPAVEEILDRAARRRYGVRSLVLQIVGSELFRHK